MISLDNLASPQRRAIHIVRQVASGNAWRPYLVGGPVRDLILDRPAIDLDFTLEEGSSAFARALAKEINGRVRSFPQFLTYKVTADDFPEIDIATARSEKYRAPGALPAVSAGTLQDDLLRRDFSINAIAFDVLAGELHDPAGGADDLEHHQIRVLHDASFIDDPTRIFRAIRLAARLDFTIESHTRDLMQQAVAGGALASISRERIWRELFLAFEETDAPRVIEALNDAGALEVLFGPRKIERLQLELAQRAAAGDAELDRQALYIGALLYGNASPVDLEGSGLSQRRARVVMQIANEQPRYADSLADGATDRQRFKVLKHASPELLAVLAAAPDAAAEHVLRFREYQKFQLALRGSDLDVPLGPHVARALERAREAVFTGEIQPQEARDFARQKAIQYLDREHVTEPSS